MAVTAIEWSSDQSTVMPWRVLRSQTDLDTAARDLSAAKRASASLTALGDALRVGVDAFAAAPCEPDRRVIDISGDGATNSGADPSGPRGDAIAGAISINGLPIVTPGEPTVGDYYRKSVVTPDGFVIEAHGFEDVERAMGRKLAAEIAGVSPAVSAFASRAADATVSRAADVVDVPAEFASMVRVRS